MITAGRFKLAYGLLGLLVLVASACGGSDEGQDSKVPSFEPLIGINFFEASRTFDNGLSYDTMGFVQVPEWNLRFIAKDSVEVYSPSEDKMLQYQIYHDHDAYFHFARESWRVVNLHPDSVVLQRLSLKGLRVDNKRSNVFMKFYSEGYIQDSLQTTVAELRKPSARDTAFVKDRIAVANAHTHVPDSGFASMNFARFIEKSDMIRVEKEEVDTSELSEKSSAYAYLYPEYTITIDRAYKDFFHYFSAVVDERGKVHIGEIYVMEGFVEAREKVIQSIIDVYFNNLLEIIPAYTLGMPHSSVVYLKVRGKAM